jgi:hypothetical protein
MKNYPLPVTHVVPPGYATAAYAANAKAKAIVCSSTEIRRRREKTDRSASARCKTTDVQLDEHEANATAISDEDVVSCAFLFEHDQAATVVALRFQRRIAPDIQTRSMVISVPPTPARSCIHHSKKL